MPDLRPLDDTAPTAFVEGLHAPQPSLRYCVIRTTLANGTALEFPLEIRALATMVEVRPRPGFPQPIFFPTCCPERHINDGGAFCLGADPSLVALAADPVGWWERLLKFLRLQRTAIEKRSWNRQAGLDHGIAWETTKKITDMIAGFPEAWVNHFGPQGERAQQYVDDHPEVRLNKDAKRLTNLRRPCLCGAGLLRRKCRGCSYLAQLLPLLRQRYSETERFWAALSGKRCCGSRMKGCRLQLP